MSAYITFKPPQEEIEKYNIKSITAKTEWKLTILMYCMKTHEESTENIISFLKSALMCWYQDIAASIKTSVYTKYLSDNEITFYYDEFDSSYCNSKEELINDKLTNLGLLTDVVATPDYFNNRTLFYDKLNNIEEELISFEENTSSIVKQEIVDELDKYKVANENSSI